MIEPQVRYGDGSEGAHWYAHGNPPKCAYQILGANGNWRNTTLADARKYGWVPGVTSIIKMAAAPGLERWKVRQAIMAALTHPKAHEVKDADELLAMIEQDSKAEARAAADRGTQIHAAIEAYYMTGAVQPEFDPYVTGVMNEIEKLVGEHKLNDWRPELTVTHPLGFGTRIDLYSEKHRMVLDFKGKEFGEDDEVRGWPEQCMQLAACRMMVGAQRAANLFVSRNVPGLVKSVPWSAAELDRGREEFLALLRFWQVRNNMSPQIGDGDKLASLHE